MADDEAPPQPRDIAVEVESPELAADLERKSRPADEAAPSAQRRSDPDDDHSA